MKYRGKRIDNGELVYGFLQEEYFTIVGVGEYTKSYIYVPRNKEQLEGERFYVENESVSVYFGKKDKNGKEIYTNDKVRYKSKEYQVRYFEEYGAFGLYDEKHNRPLGRSGSEPYFMNDYHTRQMELI